VKRSLWLPTHTLKESLKELEISDESALANSRRNSIQSFFYE